MVDFTAKCAKQRKGFQESTFSIVKSPHRGLFQKYKIGLTTNDGLLSLTQEGSNFGWLRVIRQSPFVHDL